MKKIWMTGLRHRLLALHRPRRAHVPLRTTFPSIYLILPSMTLWKNLHGLRRFLPSQVFTCNIVYSPLSMYLSFSSLSISYPFLFSSFFFTLLRVVCRACIIRCASSTNFSTGSFFFRFLLYVCFIVRPRKNTQEVDILAE